MPREEGDSYRRRDDHRLLFVHLGSGSYQAAIHGPLPATIVDARQIADAETNGHRPNKMPHVLEAWLPGGYVAQLHLHLESSTCTHDRFYLLARRLECNMGKSDGGPRINP